MCSVPFFSLYPSSPNLPAFAELQRAILYNTIYSGMGKRLLNVMSVLSLLAGNKKTLTKTFRASSND